MAIFDAHTPVNPQGRLAGKVVYITGAGAAGVANGCAVVAADTCTHSVAPPI